MTATARYIGITDEELDAPEVPRSTGTYSEIEVPGDYELTVAYVEDFKSRAGDDGWKIVYQVETSTGPCDFPVWFTPAKNMRWKVKEIWKAHGLRGMEIFEPQSIVGDVVGGTIDFPIDRNTGEPKAYREIVALFPLVDAPEVEAPAVL